MRENTTLTALRAGKSTIGGWISLGNTHAAEMLAHAGFDWLCIDLQHGLIDYTDLRNMLPAISTTGTMPFVRVTDNAPAEIMKVLDLGAMGVIVPLVNDRAEAERAVAACRYPPDGGRSFGPIRAALYGGRGYAAESNQQIACIAMIETRAGIDNIEEIAATPGLDALYVGPADLALSLGLPPQGDTDDPLHRSTCEALIEAAHARSLPIGCHAGSTAYALKRLEMGFDFAPLGSDASWLMGGASKAVADVRGALPETRESTGY
ncbi:MAG: aldolase/citrate lyase family protein [Pseudomonadota bacterium]